MTDIELNERPERADGYAPDIEYGTFSEEINDSIADGVTIALTQSEYGAPVTFCLIRNDYDISKGVRSLPRAIVPPTPPASPLAGVSYPQDGERLEPVEYDSQYDTCRMVRLHGGQCFRRIHMEITRVGQHPQIIEPTEVIYDINGIRETLTKCRISTVNPTFKRDLVNREYSIVADLEYALSRPPTNSERLRMATSPFDVMTPDESLLDQSQVYIATATMDWRSA